MQVTFLVMSGDLAEQSAPFVAATSCTSNDVLATITKVIESVLWSMTISKIWLQSNHPPYPWYACTFLDWFALCACLRLCFAKSTTRQHEPRSHASATDAILDLAEAAARHYEQLGCRSDVHENKLQATFHKALRLFCRYDTP
jgi:hypothetical protein